MVDKVIRPRRRPLLLALLVLSLLAGCSGRTTGATNLQEFVSRQEVSASAQLNAVGSCSEHCTFFMRWRPVDASAWTNGPSREVGSITDAAWHETVTGLDVNRRYEYQACGKEASWSSAVCVGPNGTANSTQKFVTPFGSNDWPQFRSDAAHSGANPFEFTIDTGNVSKLTQAWFARLRNPTSPVVANGIVYVGGQRRSGAGGIVAAYPATCRIGGERCRQRLWTAGAGSGVAGSTPAVQFGRVYVGSQDGKVYAFDASSGAPEGTAVTGGPIHSSPTVANGLVYVGSDDGKLYAFPWSCASGGTCTPLWKSATFGAITSSPAVDPLPGQGGGRVIVGSADHHVYAFNARDGGIVWTGSTGGPVRSSPTVANGVVYVGSDDGKLYAFQSNCVTSLGSCAPLWTAATSGRISSSPAVDDPDFPEHVYVGSSDHHLYAYSAACDVCSGAGQLLWSGTTGGAISSSPAVAGGVVYVGSDDGKLYAFRASGCGSSSCPPLFTATGAAPASSPAVAGGEVYFTEQSPDVATVHAYGLP